MVKAPDFKFVSVSIKHLMPDRSGNVHEVVPDIHDTWIRQLEVDVGFAADALHSRRVASG